MPVTIDRSRRRSNVAFRLLLLIAIFGSQVPLGIALGAAEGSPPDHHLVISEVVTGGASASDEMIELYNPTPSALPLEGLEVIYVSASGATVTRRTAWELGAPDVPAGGHLLVANEGGLFAPIADATFASGMAAQGGSVAIRILGATTPIDALGWGTATGSWLEGAPAAAPVPGASLERVPGGALGSWQDTGDNASDFVEREVPEPQNLASAPTPASEPPAAIPVPTPQPPTPEPTPAWTPPAPAPTPIASARTLPDDASVTIEGLALTDSDFHDGGGFVADASGGIAALVTGGSFGRGELIRLTGLLDDRFAQRTLRVDGQAAVELLGVGAEPGAPDVPTGGVGEGTEGTLVRVDATIAGAGSILTSGVAFDLDDGSGATRLVIGTGSGIDISSWSAGTRVVVAGIVGQRDSTGSGSTGYRVMPRDPADVVVVSQPSTTQAPSPSGPGASVAPSDEPPSEVVSIADARAAPKNTRLAVRGVVTLPPGIVDEDTAVLQDATGAIVLRLGGEAGALRTGQQVEVSGTRSTMSGMETLRVTAPVRTLGTATLPATPSIRSGEVGEEHEARSILVRGAIVASARRSASGSASLEIDDGSGALKVALGASLAADTSQLRAGTWVEVRAPLGQETTGSKPREGYRLWPASLAAVRIVASAGDAGGSDGGDGGLPGTEPPPADLGDLGEPNLAGLRVGATLVVGPWPELGIGGLLWDGSSLVAVDDASAGLLASALGARRPPVALELGGLTPTGVEPTSKLPLVAASAVPGDLVVRNGLVASPRSELAPTPAWVSVIGRLGTRGDEPVLRIRGKLVRLDVRCEDEEVPARGIVSVTGVALAGPLRLLVPCSAMRPVPLLADSHSHATSAISGQVRGGASLDGARGDVRNTLAAGMLLVAASGLAAAALWRRIRRDQRAPMADGAVSEATNDAGVVQDPPRLTLVRVPREHGP